MESAPGNIKVDEVRAALLALPHVSAVHDLHVWTITSGFVAVSVHLTCIAPEQQDSVLRRRSMFYRFALGFWSQHDQIDRDPSCAGTTDSSS